MVGGNAWLGLWAENDLASYTSTQVEFLSSLEKWQRTILVSLQGIDDFLSEGLMDAVRDAPPEWFWLVRLHPHHRHRIDEMAQRFEDHGIRRFDVVNTTTLPLYALLRRCTNHVTAWSSVCYEALSFHVPTVIIHRTGRALYEEYIRRGIFQYGESSAEILKAIDSSSPRQAPEEPRSYIVADIELSAATFRSLVWGDDVSSIAPACTSAPPLAPLTSEPLTRTDNFEN